MKRSLFTFGCSYTGFFWLTWSDFLSPYYKNTYNLGRCGGGNWLNFHNFSHMVSLGKIKKGDTVIIQWGSLLRELRMWSNAHYVFCPGNVLNTQGRYDLKNYVFKYFNPVQKAYELVSYIENVTTVCKYKGFNLKMFFMLEPWVGRFLGEPTSYDQIPTSWITDLQQSGILRKLKHISESSEYFLSESIEHFNLEQQGIDSCYSNLGGFSPEKIYIDLHPAPLTHYKFAKKHLAPKDIDIKKIDKKLKKIAKNWNDKLSNKKFLIGMHNESLFKNKTGVVVNVPQDFKNYTDELILPEDKFDIKVFRNINIISQLGPYTDFDPVN